MGTSDNTLGKLSEDYVKLINLVAGTPHGTLLTYEYVEMMTQVPMGRHGRDMLRKAIMRTNREYSVMIGVGYRLADAHASMGILHHNLKGIDRKVHRADRATRIIRDTFLDEMNEIEQKAVIFLGSVFGAIRIAAENGRRQYSADAEPKKGVIGPGVIPIPGMDAEE